MRGFGQLRKQPDAEPAQLERPTVDLDRLADQTEQRLESLRAAAAEQREAARELIRALGQALAAMDRAWEEFDERLGGAGIKAETEAISL